MIRLAVILGGSAPAARARVAGLTVLERALHAFDRAGAERVLVTDDLSAIDEPFVVVTADRIFDLAIARRALAADLTGAAACMMVDGRGRPIGMAAGTPELAAVIGASGDVAGGVARLPG